MGRRLGLLLGLLGAVPAFAQNAVPGFELERMSPSGTSVNSVALATGDVLQKGALKVSLMGHYEHDALVFYRNGQKVGAIVGSRFTTQVGASYGVLDWLDVGLHLPIILGQSGDELSAYGIAPVSGTVLGAPMLQVQGAFLREAAGNPLDFGLSLGLSLPLGAAAGLSRDPGSGLAFFPRLGVGRSFGGLVRVGGEVGAVVRQAVQLSSFSQVIDDQVGSMLTLGVNAVTLNEGLRGELDVRGLSPLSSTSAAAEVLVGARYAFLDKSLEAFLVGGPGLGKMPGSPLFRVLGGVAWTPLSAPRCVEGQPYQTAECPALDQDGDGVRNALDTCPTVAGLAKLDGCPDKDDDGDGVLNLADACPQQKGDAKRAGCPARDSDGDGIPDESDACPKLAGVGSAKGCPDADGDGVADADDACPALAGVSGARGCPDVDTDGDGVVDALDKCPDVKAAGGGVEGCPPVEVKAPVEEKVVVEDTGKISLSDKIYFELNKSDIQARSLTLLDKVAETLKAHPELKKVRIEGHTDNTGPADFNTRLSQSRADAVKKYLAGKGVDAKRLDAKGFGPSKPIAPNDTPAGREQNRRTEFMSVE